MTNSDGMPLSVTIATVTVIRVGVTCHHDVYSHYCVPVRDNMIMPHMAGNHLMVAMPCNSCLQLHGALIILCRPVIVLLQ